MAVTVEVLFEFKESRRQLHIPQNEICQAVRDELATLGKEDIVLELRNQSSNCSPHAYLLQKWSPRWNLFIDVTDVKDIQSGDRLTVIPKPGASPSKAPMRAESILSRVKKPSEAEAAALSKCFPSGERKPFDPSQSSQKKKKGASAPAKSKACTVDVVMLKNFKQDVPKGLERKNLKKKGRIQSVKLTRAMGEEEVERVIKRAFKPLHLTNLVFLEVDPTGHYLTKASSSVDGQQAISRRGALYICEEIDSSDSDMDVKRTVKRADKILKDLQKSQSIVIDSTSGDDSDLPDSNVTSDRKPGPISSEQPTGSGFQGEQWLVESRQIRAEQDEAFATSLALDQAKDAQAELKQRVLHLKQQLRAKLESQSTVSGGMKFSVRLPDSSKMECTVSGDKSSKMLYEMVFAKSEITTPFLIHTVHPRCVIPTDQCLSTLQLETPTVVIVECSDDAQDLLQLFSSSLSDHEPECTLLSKVTEIRTKFLSHGFHRGDVHEIQRHQVYQNVLNLYCSNPHIFTEYPFRVKFVNEMAIDAGGVSRDMFSAFWVDAYVRAFDGCNSLVPQAHPHVDIGQFPILGTILSHGFLSTGMLPVRIAFPVIAAVLLGPLVDIPVSTYISSLVDNVSLYEGTILKRAFGVTIGSFPHDLSEDLLALLSRLGCREMPTPKNLRRVVVEVAKHEFVGKPLRVLYAMNSGVPVQHHEFWKTFSVDDLFQLYKALVANPGNVIRMIKEPVTTNSAQETVFSYLIRMVGSMNQEELCNFLRFVTGSSVPVDEDIRISFNSLNGLSRRPIAHTCGFRLELPCTYITYHEFEEEFKSVLNSEYAWLMDSI